MKILKDPIDFSDIPPSYWDARRHLYAKGIQISDESIDITDIKYSREKFEFDLPVGNVTTSGLYLIGQVSDDILITRIGIRTKEHYLGHPEVRIQVLSRKNDVAATPKAGKDFRILPLSTGESASSRQENSTH